MWKDFRTFLREYKVVSVAVAFIMGIAVNDVVQSFVNNMFMPLLNPLIPETTWKDATLSIGPVHLRWGAFTAQIFQFFLLAFTVFVVVKKLIERPGVKKDKVNSG